MLLFHDLMKVKNGGTRKPPWRSSPVMGLSLPNSVEIDETCSVWVQIHDVPDGYRGETLSKNLVKERFGRFVSSRLKFELSVP
jgi:hypothetical protein